MVDSKNLQRKSKKNGISKKSVFRVFRALGSGIHKCFRNGFRFAGGGRYLRSEKQMNFGLVRVKYHGRIKKEWDYSEEHYRYDDSELLPNSQRDELVNLLYNYEASEGGLRSAVQHVFSSNHISITQFHFKEGRAVVEVGSYRFSVSWKAYKPRNQNRKKNCGYKNSYHRDDISSLMQRLEKVERENQRLKKLLK